VKRDLQHLGILLAGIFAWSVSVNQARHAPLRLVFVVALLGWATYAIVDLYRRAGYADAATQASADQAVRFAQVLRKHGIDPAEMQG
jgi:hypothetical protein